MKLNWKWVFGESFLLLIGIAGVLMLCTMHNYGKIVVGGYVFVGLITLACFLCVALSISIGEAYYQYFTLPKDQWKITKYDNMIILARHDLAWSYTYNIDEINKLDEIKSVQFYNIKKSPVKWYPIPHQQLEERKKGK